ncbi:hypothetical protein [Haloferax sulfurifontis]|uniref:Sulfatase N-terminal domain-containing protein n=1 Tax=Haloferax sulfurifontis TaxID=255616 RepID=A0A830E7H2_9EURY|nr:hypothetical protein [Haloferax sulfurifontis]GGC56948.1 hypothetical protein GCM10007209_18440 [Haloferax sulfurifontis]
MSLFDWFNSSVQSIRTDGMDGVKESSYEFRVGCVRWISNLNYNPTSVWERDWDLLIVLDACRLDLLQSVANEYQFLSNQNSLTSVASSTSDWVKKIFDPQYKRKLAQAAYVTGNPNSIYAFPYTFSNQCDCGAEIKPSHQAVYHEGCEICSSCKTKLTGEREVPVKILKEVWRRSWDNDIGTIQPRPITDTAIETSRNQDIDSMIVHYMQPHHPFIPAPELDQGSYIGPNDKERKKQSRTIWEQLRTGDVDEETVWREYKNNLRHVLEDVEILLENVDADTAVVTSDHGNAIGEYGIYGHPRWMPIDPLVTVPWYETTGTDNKTHTPTESVTNSNVTSEEVTQRLQDLGYF